MLDAYHVGQGAPTGDNGCRGLRALLLLSRGLRALLNKRLV